MRFRPRVQEQSSEVADITVVRAATDPRLPHGGFELSLTAAGTSIRAQSDGALRHAHLALRNLAPEDRRVGIIVDWPDFDQRAYMLDISRDRVPTSDTLAWLVETLSRLRYTQLQLYVEHTFAYSGHDVVWRDASPLTPSDLGWLDALCDEHGIELVANLNTFGHFDRWLRHNEYRDRAECPDGSPPLLGGELMPPWSLAPTQENATFAIGLAEEMLSALTSRTVNVGADEPFDLGRGRSSDDVSARGREVVYLEHLRRIVDPLIAQGCHVQFWGDVLRRHPELVAQLPSPGATAVVWNYEAPMPDGPSVADLFGPDLVELLGLPDDAQLGFEAHIRSFIQTGYPFWVAAGTSTWNTLVGRWGNARANLLDAARTGRTRAGGFMVTDWGDNGHHQPLPISLPAMVYGAAVAWNAELNEDLDIGAEIDALLQAQPGTGALLIELGSLAERIGVSTFNGSAIAMVLHRNPPFPVMGVADVDALLAARAVAQRAVDVFTANPFGGPRADVLSAELAAASALTLHGIHRLLALSGTCPLDAVALQAEYEAAIALQRAAWLAGAQPGGLQDSLDRFAPPPAP